MHMTFFILLSQNGNFARVLLAAHTITGNATYLKEGLRWYVSAHTHTHTHTHTPTL